MIYKVKLKCEGEYTIEADNEDDAREIAWDYMTDGDAVFEFDVQEEDDGGYFEPDFSEMGFDPYLGQYTDDC